MGPVLVDHSLQEEATQGEISDRQTMAQNVALAPGQPGVHACHELGQFVTHQGLQRLLLFLLGCAEVTLSHLVVNVGNSVKRAVNLPSFHRVARIVPEFNPQGPQYSTRLGHTSTIFWPYERR